MLFQCKFWVGTKISFLFYYVFIIFADDGDDNDEFWGVLGGLIDVTQKSDPEEEENEVWLYK